MIPAIRSARTCPLHSLFITTPLQVPAGRKTSDVCFRQVKTAHSQPDSSQSMEKENSGQEKLTKNPNEKTGDIMSHSFGEGYATRSDEEGFGGIYGRNQSIPKSEEDNSTVHENHPDYDNTRGSEGKGKGKKPDRRK